MWGFLASELAAVRAALADCLVTLTLTLTPTLTLPLPLPLTLTPTLTLPISQVRAALADCRASFLEAAGWEAQCERVLRCNAAMCASEF